MLIIFLNTYGPLIILFGTIFYLVFERKYSAIVALLIAVFLTTVIVVFTKELYLVPRPLKPESGSTKAGLDYYSSFPSNHAAIGFCIAAFGYLHKRRLGFILFVLAILVSVGRVWANVHTPLDVAIGALVGLIIGILLKGLTDST